MWGQTLTGNEPDSYPRLTDDPAAKVYKVSFMMKNASGEGQTEEETEEYTEYSAAYTNTGGTVKLLPEPESDQYQFAGWSQSESAEEPAFIEETAVSGDRKVYAFGQEKYAGIDPEKNRYHNLRRRDRTGPVGIHEICCRHLCSQQVYV